MILIYDPHQKKLSNQQLLSYIVLHKDATVLSDFRHISWRVNLTYSEFIAFANGFGKDIGVDLRYVNGYVSSTPLIVGPDMVLDDMEVEEVRDEGEIVDGKDTSIWIYGEETYTFARQKVRLDITKFKTKRLKKCVSMMDSQGRIVCYAVDCSFTKCVTRCTRFFLSGVDMRKSLPGHPLVTKIDIGSVSTMNHTFTQESIMNSTASYDFITRQIGAIALEAQPVTDKKVQAFCNAKLEHQACVWICIGRPQDLDTIKNDISKVILDLVNSVSTFFVYRLCDYTELGYLKLIAAASDQSAMIWLMHYFVEQLKGIKVPEGCYCILEK